MKKYLSQVFASKFIIPESKKDNEISFSWIDDIEDENTKSLINASFKKLFEYGSKVGIYSMLNILDFFSKSAPENNKEKDIDNFGYLFSWLDDYEHINDSTRTKINQNFNKILSIKSNWNSYDLISSLSKRFLGNEIILNIDETLILTNEKIALFKHLVKTNTDVFKRFQKDIKKIEDIITEEKYDSVYHMLNMNHTLQCDIFKKTQNIFDSRIVSAWTHDLSSLCEACDIKNKPRILELISYFNDALNEE